MAAFKFYQLNLGEIKAGVATKVFFPFEDLTKKDVTHVKVACGCTANAKINEDGISATYTPAMGHEAKTISVTLNETKYSGLNDNGTAKNKINLVFHGTIS